MRSLPLAPIKMRVGCLKPRAQRILAPALDFTKRQSRKLLIAFVLAAICAIVIGRYLAIREANTLRYINENAIVVGCQPNFCRLQSGDGRSLTSSLFLELFTSPTPWLNTLETSL
jgi:hypothetical protein